MYSAGDVKWGETTLGEPSGTITWNPGDFTNGLNLTSGTSVADINFALGEAFSAWESVAAVSFQQVTGVADLDFASASLDPQVAGTAAYSYDGNPGLSQIFDGEITFATGLTWSDFGAGGTNFYAVALHEIGHIIGLDHVNDTSEIMNPVISTDDLGDGDIAGAQYLYGTDGNDEPAPLPPSGSGGIADSGDDDGGGAGGAIGLVVGLLALIIGLFTGGAGAAVALAAGKVAIENEDDDVQATEGAHDDLVAEEAHGVLQPDGTFIATHVSYIDELPLPMIDFGEPPVVEEDDGIEEAFFI